MRKFRVFHRDIKPQNILIDEYLNVKIADYGLSRIGGDNFSFMTK